MDIANDSAKTSISAQQKQPVASSTTTSKVLWSQITHQRFRPTQHRFNYDVAQFWLALDEIPAIAASSRLFVYRDSQNHARSFAPLCFDACRLLPDSIATTPDLSQRVLNKLTELTGAEVFGRVFFMGNLTTFGAYFSPLNCYFVQPDPNQPQCSYMLAEVSNTPWLERHYYAVPMTGLQLREEHEKAFHVSPFNPLAMRYKWRVQLPEALFTDQALDNSAAATGMMLLEAWQQHKDFMAQVEFSAVALNPKMLRRVLWKYPMLTMRILRGIYWQALKLWFKRTPLYTHPKQK